MLHVWNNMNPYIYPIWMTRYSIHGASGFGKRRYKRILDETMTNNAISMSILCMSMYVCIHITNTTFWVPGYERLNLRCSWET